MKAAHLAKRFFTSLWPGGPTAADDAWALHYLNAGETMLWRRMAGFDRRHAVGVARRVCAALGDDATRPVVAAALLHDVGKIESGFGVWRRVGATVLTAVRGRDRVTGRVATYVNHPALGAALLREAAADPVTAAWAQEHHLPPERWTLDAPIAAALKNADDD
ncbi:MAG TPA: HD domain-containing protein [Acidimicrobiales bacterium]|nr:HD domain-containing protein [Acidimicrobiales bacterium]